MKKILIISATILVSCTLNAQVLIAAFIAAASKNDKIELGVKLGVNLSDANTSTNHPYRFDSKWGMQIGLTADYKLSETRNIYFMSGIEHTTKGGNISIENEKRSFNLRYIQLPIHLGYKIPLNKKNKVVLRGGGYVAYARRASLDNDDISINMLGNLARSKGISLSRFDAGVGLAAGMEFGKIGTTIGYDMGLVDFDRTTHSMKNSNAYLCVAYKF